MLDVWRPRSDCLTNSLSFQTPYFWCGQGFELMLSLKSGLTGMFPMGYIQWHDPDPAN
jgi:hypothetical protein